jgi:hypothetical protein
MITPGLAAIAKVYDVPKMEHHSQLVCQVHEVDARLFSKSLSIILNLFYLELDLVRFGFSEIIDLRVS